MKKIGIMLALIFTTSMFFMKDIDLQANDLVTITFVVAEEGDVSPSDVTAPDSISGISGNQLIHIPVLSSSTHTFLGWYKNVEGEKVYVSKGDIINEDITLYGSWRLTTRVIQYELNGGTNHDDNPFLTNSITDTLLKDPLKEGYVFLGWFVDDTEISVLTNIIKSLTVLEARWTPVTVTMTIDLKNGTTPVSYEYDYDESYSLQTPTYTGYTFLGFEIDGQTFTSSGTISLTSDFTVEAIWSANVDTPYNVETYLENLDGTYTSSRVLLTGTTGIIITLTPESMMGYSYNASLSTTSGSIVGDGTLTLEMYYDREVYTVTFVDIDDQTIETQQVKYLDDAVLPTYSIDGYQVSWEETKLQDINQDTTIRVILTANQYTISFDQIGVENKTVTFNQSIGALEIPNAPEGKVFNAWKDTNGNIYTQATIYTKSDDLMLYAEFIDIPEYEYQVKYYFENTLGNFELNEALTQFLTAQDGASVTALELDNVPLGFELAESLSSGNVNASTTLILSVRYQRVTYTVTFVDANNDIIKTDSVKYALDATPPTYNVDGYQVSWDASIYENIQSDATISPILTEIDYTIEYQYMNDAFDNEVTHMNAATGYSITTDVQLTSPTSTYYNFDGWYLNANYSDDFLTSIEEGTTGNLVLYAKWSLKTYTVTFQAEGNNSESISIEHGSTIAFEDIPNMTLENDKIGYYWYYTDNNIDYEFDLSLPVAQNYELTLLVVDAVTIQYVYNYDNTIENVKIAKGAILHSSDDPEREGYTFVDWYIDDTFTTSYTFEEVVTENVTLYAKWIPTFGEAIYSTPGTYSWTVPDGVTTISVLAIGSSGATSSYGSIIAYGEAGGAGWINNYTVNSGETYTVVVGQAYNSEVSYFGSESLVAGFGGDSGSIVAYSRAEYGAGFATFVGDGGINGANGSSNGTGAGYDIYNPNLSGGFGSSNDGVVRIVWDLNGVEFPSTNTSSKVSTINSDTNINQSMYVDEMIDWDTSENSIYYTSISSEFFDLNTRDFHRYTYYINSISYVDNTKKTLTLGYNEIDGKLQSIDDLYVLHVDNGDLYVTYKVSSGNYTLGQYLKIFDSDLQLKETYNLDGAGAEIIEMVESDQYVYVVFNDRGDTDRTAYYQIQKSSRDISLGNINFSNVGENLPVMYYYNNIYTAGDSLYLFDNGNLVVVDALGNISNNKIDASKSFSDELVITQLSNDEIMVLVYNLSSKEIEYYIYDITIYETYLSHGVITNSNSFNQSELLNSQYVFVIGNILYINNSQYMINLDNYSLNVSLHEMPYIDIFLDKTLFKNSLLYLVYEDNNSLYTVDIVE